MKLHKVFIFLLLIVFAVVHSGKAQSFKFRPTLSVFESYTHLKDYNITNSGIFSTENRKFNFGLELTQKVYLEPSVFFNLGIRYQHFKKNVYALNQVPELYNYPHPFYWEYRYTSFTMPLHFGKDYYINGKKKGDWYFGLSLGALMTSSFTAGTTYPQPRESSFTEPILAGSWGDPDTNPAFFYSNVDVGFNFIPLKEFTKLSIGFWASAQLNKTGEINHRALVEVPTKGYDFFYDQHNRFRTFNFAVSLNYSF